MTIKGRIEKIIETLTNKKCENCKYNKGIVCESSKRDLCCSSIFPKGYEPKVKAVSDTKCNQLCPYNTLKGCKVAEMNGICPISQAGELFEKTEQLPPLVKTGELLGRGKDLYEVVIADDNIFVVCPLEYSKKERCVIVKYSHPEIYANQCAINTLSDLGFWGVK